MNMKAVNTNEEQDQSLKLNYLTFKGASVMWPPDCTDDMLENAISLAKTYQQTCKVNPTGTAEKDQGAKNEGIRETDYAQVGIGLLGCREAEEGDGFEVQTILACSLRQEFWMLRDP